MLMRTFLEVYKSLSTLDCFIELIVPDSVSGIE